MPCAIITGIGGQDGSYLSEFLLTKNYSVYGMIRRHSSLIILDRLNTSRKNPNFHLTYGDITDIASIMNIFNEVLRDPASNDGPIEVYNLAAQSHVKVSFDSPMYTSTVSTIGVLNILETILKMNLIERVRFYQASTSELYGSSLPPQNEETPFCPRSPYAIAKLYAYWIVRNYRESYNMFATNGILFNHESERRGETFVTRKITRTIAEICKGTKKTLVLGNLDAKRDWGYAADYVEAMWEILQQSKPEDFVIATGEAHSVREFVEEAFKLVNINIKWSGEGLNEKGINEETNEILVSIDKKYYRPTEVNHLCGDPTKANTVLKWKPKVNFKDLVKIMLEYDIKTI